MKVSGTKNAMGEGREGRNEYGRDMYTQRTMNPRALETNMSREA